MKSSEILEEAARYLAASAPNAGVCSALGRQRRVLMDFESREKIRDIQTRIQVSIAPRAYVSGWLYSMGYAGASEDAIALHDYRVRWCRWMAEGYRAKGD